MSHFRQVQRVVLSATSPVAITLTLDASVSETHSKKVEVTKHPLEVGADVTDHIRVLGDGLELVGVVSNWPIVSEGQAVQPAVAGGDAHGRAEDAYAELGRAMEAGAIFQVVTSLKTYDGLALVGLSCARDAPRGNIAELQMSFEELQFAATERADAPVARDPSRNNRVDTGKQSATEASAPARESVLSSIGGALFGG